MKQKEYSLVETAREMDVDENLGRRMLANIRHALGADHPRHPGYRNSYCCEIDSDDTAMWECLVGLRVAQRGPTINEGRDRYYTVVDPPAWL